MRTSASSLLPVSLAVLLGSCMLSDFSEAVRRERERDQAVVAQLDAGAPRPAANGGAGGRQSSEQAGMLAHAVAGQAGAERDEVAAAGRAGGAGSAHAGNLATGHAGSSGAGDAGSAHAGRGAAGRAGSSGQAGSGGGGAAATGVAGCGDLSRDPTHCGRCDNDCHADMALATCEDAKCVRACSAGYGDCNADLASGNLGDGCETELLEDPDECGGCGLRCAAPSGTVPFCDAGGCMVFQLDVAAGVAVSEVHGGVGGGNAYENLCAGAEVLVGVDAAIRDTQLIGFAGVCAHAGLNGDSEQLTVFTDMERVLAALGNNLANVEKTPSSRMACPSGAMLTAVSGVLANFNTNILNVKQLLLTCSQPELDADGVVSLREVAQLQLGAPDGAVAAFGDACPSGQVVVGFVGRHGGLIDALQTLCAPLAVMQRPGAIASE